MVALVELVAPSGVAPVHSSGEEGLPVAVVAAPDVVIEAAGGEAVEFVAAGCGTTAD